MGETESQDNLSVRLSSIQERLLAYEARQRTLLGNRGDSPSLVISPGEDPAEVERAHRMVQRGGLMYPPATEEEVALFESTHRVELPADYRRFITEVGNGGEGPPFYGLLPLGATPEHHVPGNLREGYRDLLCKPFSFEQPWVWEGEAPSDELEARMTTVAHGNLILGHQGCGEYWALVVTGNQKGQIWSLADVGIGPCAPALRFLDWYEYWLEGGADWWRDYAPSAGPESPAGDTASASGPPARRPW